MKNLPLIPDQASEFAQNVDPLFWVLVLLTVAFTGAVMFMLVVMAIRYRRSSNADRSRRIDEHHMLEITWSVVPLLLGLGVFVWGAKLFAGVFGPAPANSLEVYVMGKQWMWHIQHSNGIRENNEMHVPVGRPVKLTMISQDAIHDFFVPAFRIHMDVVPGRYTSTWFTPTVVGHYRLYCAQYCGTNHSLMVGWVTVMSTQDYARWISNGGNHVGSVPSTMVQRGQAIYEQYACGQCHDAGGAQRGPTLIGLYKSTVRLGTGQTVVADDIYLRRSILNPSDDVADKYQQVMPSYKDQLKEEQVLDLIAYIKGMSSHGGDYAEPLRPTGSTGSSVTDPADER